MKAVRMASLTMALCLAAGEAAACSILIPPPGPGVTMLQAATRLERAEQRRLRRVASHVYLARVVASPEGGYFEPVLAIDGASPPRRVPARNPGACEPSEPASGELRVVFARRLDRAEFPWRPWRWGQGVLLGSRRPTEVADRDLAAAFKRAAAND